MATRPETTALAAPLPAEQQIKAMENNLRKIAKARIQFGLEHGHWPASLADLFTPDEFIKDIVSVTGEDYSTIPLTGDSYQVLRVVGPNGVVASYDPSRSDNGISTPLSPAEEKMRQSSDILRRLDPALTRKAVEAYRAAHATQRPPANDPRAIVPYFESAQDGANYLKYVELREAALGMLETEAQATQRK